MRARFGGVAQRKRRIDHRHHAPRGEERQNVRAQLVGDRCLLLERAGPKRRAGQGPGAGASRR
jgi:hypothetical protein